MKNTYYIATIEIQRFEDKAKVEDLAFKFDSSGIEEFSIDEPTVDAMLGERSYSGGDLPQSVLDEVDGRLQESLFKIKAYFASEEQALAFKQKMNDLNFSVVIEECLQQDWNAEWRRHYKEIIIDPHFKIIPSWEKEEGDHDNLFIYPGMGFGTGDHSTTFLCLKLYRKYLANKKVQSCMDFGAGSGILGLACKKHWAQAEVALFDIDEDALKNAQQNISLNNFTENEFVLALPSKNQSCLQKKYDLVFANILLQTLLQEQKTILSMLAPQGDLILSGLLKGQEDEVIQAYSGQRNLEVVEIAYQKDWVAIYLKGLS